MKKSRKIFFCSILLFSFLNCFSSSESVTRLSESLKEENITEEITIYYTYIYRIYTTAERNFYLDTDYNDTKDIFNSSDIEEKSEFHTSIYNSYDLKATCRLWKPTNENLKIFCKIEDTSSIYSYYSYYLNGWSFNYSS